MTTFEQHTVAGPDATANENLVWIFQHNQHNPGGQLSPLEFDLQGRWALQGMGHACAEFGRPVTEVRARLWNTYPYMAFCPADVSPERAQEMQLASDAVVEQRAVELEESWPGEFLPRIEALLKKLELPDPAAPSDTELADHLLVAQELMAELWRLHFIVDFPARVAMSEFEDLYRCLFEDEDSFAAYRLMGGVENLTVQGAHELWLLGQRAAELPSVRAVLTETESAEVLKELEHTPEGREFAAELQAYLRTYGQRGEDVSLTLPTWIEDPTPAIHGLKAYLEQPESSSPRAMQQRAQADAERAREEIRPWLEGCPRPVIELFERLLSAARMGTRLSEDHAFYIDYGATARLRTAVVAAGQRLTSRGVLDRWEDVFLLHLEELTAALRGTGSDCRELAAARDATMREYSSMRPPPTLGEAVGTAPAAEGWMERLLGRYEGEPASQDSDGTVTGAPGSPGIARGTARVLTSLDEAYRIAPGNVLVAQTTSSTWTPLFTVAGAVVTEVGGILSHCAVVAREYELPAVVGAGGATQLIRDGQLVEVDGDRGVVRLLDADGR